MTNTALKGILILSVGLLAACSGMSGNEDKGELTTTTQTSSVTLPGVPGGMQQQVTELDATVKAIDHKTRSITLVDKAGNQKTFTVPEEAVNFSQIEKGDEVYIAFIEEFDIYLKEKGAPAGEDGAAALVGMAPAGEKPAAIAAGAAELFAKVTALDLEKHTATLQFADGSSQVVKVRPDVVLDKKQIGQEVVFRSASALVLQVQKKAAQ